MSHHYLVRPVVFIVLLAVLVPAAVFAAESSESARVLNEADLQRISWRNVGPANMGGRVSAIALVPGSRTSFYVGYATGGVFFTDNLGTTFSPVFDDYPVLSIGALAVADAPADWPGWAAEDEDNAGDGEAEASEDRGKGKIVWVGTGEGNGRNSSSWGGGVYRSTDAGASFEHVGLTETHDIPSIAVDPRNPDVCYVAALGHLWGENPERGLFKTGDGGETWEQVLTVDQRTGACDVVLDPSNPDTVYAALYVRKRTAWSFKGNSEQGGIFRSDDAGRTWKKLTSGLPPSTGRIGLTLFPGDTSILYANVESDFGGRGHSQWDNRSPSGGLFRTDDRGETWVRTTDISFRPFYFSRVAVDPEDDQRVYLPGWDLAISDDGGRTFRRSGSENVHVDFHAIVINPVDTRQILVGNDGGIYVSHDRARTWRLHDSVAAAQFYRVSVDMSDPYRIAGGLQDNGSWLGPSETGFLTLDQSADGILNSDWRMISGGDGFTVDFDPTDPNLVYSTSQGGNLARIRLDNNVVKVIRPAVQEGDERLRFNWDAPFFVSPHDPSVLYHGGNRVFKLTGRGDLVFAISGDLSRDEPGKTETLGSGAETYGTVTALAESPLRQGMLWAGTDDGLVHVTVDDGENWQQVTPAEVDGLYISRIHPSAHDPETAYLSVDGHRSDVFKPLVLMTGDAGRSWTDITANLPGDEPVRVVREDLWNPEVLYAGTEFSIFVSLDRGGNWVRMNGESLPPVAVHDIVQHPREKDLVIGTHGRGVYVLDDSSMFAGLTAGVTDRPLALLEIQPGTPRFYLRRSYGSGHAIFRARNPAPGTAINYWLRESLGTPVSISITDATGTVVRTLSGPGYPGLNRVVWDLQADGKHQIPRIEAGDFGQTEFVPAGEYTVSVSAGELRDKGTVVVKAAPK